MSLPWSPALLELAHTPAGLTASYIDSLLPAATQMGLDIPSLLAEVGLDLAQLRSPLYRLSLFKAFDLLLRAEQQSADALLALRLAQQVQPRSFQLLGYICISCATLGEAIQRLQRFETLVWDIGHIESVDEGETLALTGQAPELAWLPRQVVEMAISGWLALGRQLSSYSDAFSELRVEFRHRLIEDAQHYQDILGCPVRGGAGRNALLLPKTLLSMPLRQADPLLNQLMHSQAQAHLSRRSSLAEQVRGLLLQNLPYADCDAEHLAAQLGLNLRSLRRGLQAEGLSLQQLLDEVRHDLALAHLRHSSRSLMEIACLLGFADQSAFTRAFRRWQACAPSAWRRRRTANLSSASTNRGYPGQESPCGTS